LTRKTFAPLIAIGTAAFFLASGGTGPTPAVWGDVIISVMLLAGCLKLAASTVDDYPTHPPQWTLFSGAVGAACGVLAWKISAIVLEQWLSRTHPAHWRAIAPTIPARAAIYTVLACATAVATPLRKRLAALEEECARAADTAALRREAELFKLRQQFGPHFLYNSLNSVAALVAIAPDKAQDMIGRLALFMRRSVRRDGTDAVPLAEELEYLRDYLAIEAVRFADRLMVEITGDEAAPPGATIPPFLLQPLLENAVKYGVYGTTGRVAIRVEIAALAGALRIAVQNPYDPLTAPPAGTGFGLEGVGRRLAIIYGRTDLLSTQKTADTFTTTLLIPQTATAA